jgi:hypothetical protein
MGEWYGVLHKPEALRGTDELEGWFTDIANLLLNGVELMVGKTPHRFVELEFYHYGDAHHDVFAHRDPVQLQLGRWYFHKTRGVYRGGSFKGLDLAFGDGRCHGGVLIRSIEVIGGKLIDGPSLCVDHLLDSTGAETVAALDKAIAERPMWESSSPLSLRPVADRGADLYQSGRVGLTLKKLKTSPEPPRYILRNYRYLTEPRRVSKGKIYLALALHAAGQDPATIRETTNVPKASLERYLADFEEGRQSPDFGPFFGIDLGPRDLCRLHGVWHGNFGQKT